VVAVVLVVLGLVVTMGAGVWPASTGHLVVTVGTAAVAVLIVLAALVAVVIRHRHRAPAPRRAREPVRDHAAAGDRDFESRKALDDALGVAERRWVHVAGPDADPAAVAEIILRYQPRHDLVTELVGESPAVRAVERVATQHRQAWDAARNSDLRPG